MFQEPKLGVRFGKGNDTPTKVGVDEVDDVVIASFENNFDIPPRPWVVIQKQSKLTGPGALQKNPKTANVSSVGRRVIGHQTLNMEQPN